MNPYKIFVESMQQAGIDPLTIDAVAAIHNAIYEAAEDDSGDNDDKKDEPQEKEEKDEGAEENFGEDGGDAGEEEFKEPEEELPENFEPDETPSEAANEPNADEGAKAIMYNILTLMNAKQNAYQQYHWNAESKSLHEKAQECYELYQETKDKVAETLQATYNENIDFKVWSGKIPNLTDKGAFLASVDEDLDKISEFRSQLEHFETFGLNGTLDGFIDTLTAIKYHLVRFFENKDV
jgi:hypothetical protein